MIFKTERLILRKWTLEDAESLYFYAKEAEVGLPCGWLPHKNIDESKKIIETLFLPDIYAFAVCLKGDGKAIGSIGIILSDKSHLNIKENEAELGCWIGKEFWGQGFMVEAMNILIEFAFEKLGIERIYCSYSDGNEKSKRLQEKCGFKYFNTEDKRFFRNLNEFRKSHTNILIKGDWLELKKIKEDKIEIIRSKENKLVKELKKLKLKKYRDDQKKFLAEGIKFLDYLEHTPEMIIIREDVASNQLYLEKILRFNLKKIVVDEKIFSNLSSQENSQGVLILYSKKTFDLNNLSENIIILDDVSDPGNLGTIIRVCDATNFKDIILTKGCVDSFNDKVIRASMGSILNVNLIYMEREEILNFLQDKNYNSIATYLDKSAIPYNKIKLKNKNAVILGNEGRGIGKDFLEIANTKTIIPILSNTESLNVAVASALILYKIREIQGFI